MKTKFYYLFLIVLIACQQKVEKNVVNRQLKISKVKGVVVPDDSLLAPLVISITDSKLKKTPVRSSVKLSSHQYIFPSGEPKVTVAGMPLKNQPGKNGIESAKITNVIGKHVPVGIPEEVVAKEAIVKDANHANFSFYKTLQGLNHNSIRCLLQDQMGNLWFGTYGEGVTRFNGKTFTNFTEAQGLANNYVFCMMEDRAGNIWFGTENGVSCFNGQSFCQFTNRDGLGANVVFSLLEDKNGHIWCGTNGGGVSKYDGKTFTTYNKKSGLINDFVWSMLEDKTGKIWMGTEAGLSCFNGDVFQNYTTEQGLCGNGVWSMLEDKIGNLWFGTEGNGVCKYNGNLIEQLENEGKNFLTTGTDSKANSLKTFINYTEKEGLSSNFVFSMLEDKYGNIWFGTYGGGASKFDGNRIENLMKGMNNPFVKSKNQKTPKHHIHSTFTNYGEKEGLPSSVVKSIIEDQSGNLWFATYGGGVARYNGQSFTNYTKNEGLGNNVVWSVSEDAQGKVWIGTFGGGVSVCEGEAFNSADVGFYNYTEKEGLANNFVMSILKDRLGNMWIGTNGGGVTKYDGRYFTNYTEADGLAGNQVSSIYEDVTGNIWFGTLGNGVSCYNGNCINSASKKDTCKSKNKYNQQPFECFVNYSQKQGLSNNHISCILQDRNTNMWFGTNGGGISCFNGKTFLTISEKQGLNNDYVMCLLEDHDGNFWCGTDGGGLSRYNGKSMITFTEKDGLSNNTVLNLIQDKNDNVWIGTREGISKITRKNLDKLSHIVSGVTRFDPIQEALFYNYGFNDGFVGYTCRKNAVFQDSKNKIWWGADVLTCYTPEGDLSDTTAPLINLTNVKLFGEEIHWSNLMSLRFDSLGRETKSLLSRDTMLSNGVLLHDIKLEGLTKWYNLPEHLSLPYNNNNLRFTFSGIHMQSRNHIKYQYKLSGHEDNWNSITDNTEAPYGNLPSGNYVFEVKAMNQSGVWSEPFKFQFEIRPPWWSTWWFRTLLLLVVITSVVVVIKFREKKFKTEKEKLENIVLIRTAEVLSEKKLVEEKNIEITNSISYAQRIQQALLPDRTILSKVLPDWFIVYRPKEIVSGDFYYFKKINDTSCHLAVADSTGHGVSGGFMSMLGLEMLDEAARRVNEPGEILSLLNKSIRTSLKHSETRDSLMDGFDIAFCTIDFAKGDIKFAGALRPLWILRKGAEQMEEIKGSRLSIGAGARDEKYYETHQLHLGKGDSIYLFTDGYVDQFNHENRRLTSKRFRDFLLSIKEVPMAHQGARLDERIESWKGAKKQTDDILVIGIKF